MYIAAYGKCTLIRIGDQPSLGLHGTVYTPRKLNFYNLVPISSLLQSCSNTVFDVDSIVFSFQYCKYRIDSSVTTNSIVSWLDSTTLDLHCIESY